MAKKKKTISMLKSFILPFVTLGIILVLLLVGGFVLVSQFAKTGEHVLLIISIVYVLVFSGLYAAVSFFIIHEMRKIYYKGLYKTTSSILRNLTHNTSSDDKFSNARIEEFIGLNQDLERVNTIFSNATLISNDISSAYIPLNYISLEDGLVTLESFKNELRALIYCAQNFRNVVLEVYYPLEEDELNEEMSKRIIQVIRGALLDYENILIAPNEDKTGFYVFIPHINSFSHIEERLTAAMKDLSITEKTFDGLATISARFSIVCYPYSNIEEIFPDLQYAKRQGKVINLYLPNRLTALSESKLTQNSMNLNNMSRALEKLTKLKISSREKDSSIIIIREALESISTYLGIDYCGIIQYDEVNSRFFPSISVKNEKEDLFKEGTVTDKEFVNVCNEIKDPDGSYYFSSRTHAGYKVAKFLDRINISGGFYYVVTSVNQPVAMIYFFNKIRDLPIDSYIRESLFIFSARIGDFLTLANDEMKINNTYKEINDIMMSSNYYLYRIDRNTYELMSYSNHLSNIFPKVKYGEKCYRALYGLESVCPDCPLKTSRKKMSVIDEQQFETSLTLNSAKTRLIRMMVHHVSDDSKSSDRFDNDLLINSYPSLVTSLANLYTIHSRGYLLLLKIDNNDILLKEAGSEGYLYLLRQFISEIKEAKLGGANIYFYSPDAIAVLLPECGQIDLVNFIERTYDVSKKHYQFNDTNYSFNITYLPYTFPQQFPIAEDFLKYVLRHFNAREYEIGKDYITFPDSGYTRSASRTSFMLSVIEEQFGNKTFSVALQPMVRAIDKYIYGAEILIRLSDKYRNSVFNADELIRVAGQNGKISLISNALVTYIGELYQQYGLTVFKIFGFSRLTMNTDFSYFDDPDFFQTIYNLFTTYHLPRDFLGFEITEKEIYTHIEAFKKVSRGILNHHIALIVDQYSGEFLSLSQIKSLGFTEIKIGRRLVGDIEVNPKHLAEITSIDELAQQNDLKVTFVGVENSDQYQLLRDMDKKCNCQGYHFYKPLDDYKLIEELRKNK